MIELIAFDPNLVANTGGLFPSAIEDDPWIYFHGTSGNVEGSIERRGLDSARIIVTKAEVASVVAIFDELHWSGRHAGGLAVLKPFSLNHDFAVGAHKPIYLAETSGRASVFACRDFAGGESVRALRYAIQDLTEYFSDARISKEHVARLEREYEPLVGTSHYPQFLREGDVERIASRVTALTELQSRCRAPFDDHPYGVIYAIGLSNADAVNLEYHASMGLKAWESIPKSQMLAKMRIPQNYEPPKVTNPRAKRRHDHRLVNGILPVIADRERTGRNSARF